MLFILVYENISNCLFLLLSSVCVGCFNNISVSYVAEQKIGNKVFNFFSASFISFQYNSIHCRCFDKESKLCCDCVRDIIRKSHFFKFSASQQHNPLKTLDFILCVCLLAFIINVFMLQYVYFTTHIQQIQAQQQARFTRSQLYIHIHIHARPVLDLTSL